MIHYDTVLAGIWEVGSDGDVCSGGYVVEEAFGREDGRGSTESGDEFSVFMLLA